MRSLFYKCSLVVVSAVVLSSGWAQNLVVNPSFENVNLGSLNCSWYTSQAQFNAGINNWTCPTGGSTDIFHTSLNTTCYCSPFSTNAASPGQQAPRTGDCFLNITVYGNGGCSPYREYIQGELTTPLTVGQTYEVEMWVTLADNMTVGVDNLGILFGTAPVNVGSMCVYNATPQLNYTGPIIIDKTNWVPINFCFTPTQAGLQYFMIGNFFDDASTNTMAAGGGTGNTIRYFIEDVRVELATSGSGNAGTPGTLTLCPTDPPSDLFNSLGGTPDNTGTWTGPSVLPGGHLGTFDPATATPGVYTYTVPGGGPCGAGGGGTATVTVNVSPNLDPTITPAGPFCVGDPALNLTAADPGGTWSGNGITDVNLGTFDPATAGIGSHTITYTIPGGCGGTDTETIVVNATSDATISPAGPFCESNAAATMAAVDPGGTWSGTGIIDPNAGTFDPTTAGPGTHTITYAIAGACGATDTEQVIVIADADATITPAGPFCTTDPVFSMVGADPAGNWSANCGACINATTGDFDPATAGNGTWTITYTIGGACGDTDTETIIVTNQLDATVTPAGPFCDGDPIVTMTAVDPGGTWSATCGACIDVNTGAFDPATAGAGTHTVTYSIPGNCGDTQNTTVDVLQTANAAITPAGPFCHGNAPVFLVGADPGGTWSGPGIVDPLTGEFDPSISGGGTHIITYTIAGQCGNQETTTIVVNDPLGVVALTDQTICLGGSANISALPSGGDGNYVYAWVDGGGNPVGATQTITVSPTVTTTYTVTLSDGCGSTAPSASVTITVEPLPTIDFGANPTSGCSPLTVQFTDNSTPAGTLCLWDFGDSFTSQTCGTVSHTYTAPGCYDVTLTVTTASGCTSSMTQNSMVCVTPNAQPAFTYTPDQATVSEPTVSFTNFSQNATSYEWDFGDGSTSTEQDPVHQFTAVAGTYNVCLAAMNADGCNDTLCQAITVLDEFLIYVPNTFTPDGDGINDVFKPFASGYELESFEMFIFDRWGELIFETNNVDLGWDGTDPRGNPAKQDVYVWKIKLENSVDGGKKEYIGHVTLLR